jgi:hypothetical protein
METVFLLWHSHDLGDGKTDDELVGVYSSVDEAEAAKARKLQLEGIRDAADGFLIDRYALNRDASAGRQQVA